MLISIGGTQSDPHATLRNVRYRAVQFPSAAAPSVTETLRALNMDPFRRLPAAVVARVEPAECDRHRHLRDSRAIDEVRRASRATG